MMKSRRSRSAGVMAATVPLLLGVAADGGTPARVHALRSARATMAARRMGGVVGVVPAVLRKRAASHGLMRKGPADLLRACQNLSDLVVFEQRPQPELTCSRHECIDSP